MYHVPQSARRGAMYTLTAGCTPGAQVQPWFPSFIRSAPSPGWPPSSGLTAGLRVCLLSWLPHACLRAPHELALSYASGCVHAEFLSNILHRALPLCLVVTQTEPSLGLVEWELMSFTGETRPCVWKYQPQSVSGTQRMPNELLASCSVFLLLRPPGSGHL